MTPYKIEVGMPQDEANYNYYHSKARIVVEQSIGLMKSKWKRVSHVLYGTNPRNLTKLIRGCMVLHNWLIDDDLGNTLVLEQISESPNKIDREERIENTALVRRDILKRYINENIAIR
jgi:hypothetical protein